MKASLVKRLGALEERQLTAVRVEDQRSERLREIHLAQGVGFALKIGIRAQEDLAAANGSIDPSRRARLEQQVAAAESIAAVLVKHSNRR